MWTLIEQFRDFPIPPSVNSAYINVPGRGRVASMELKSFKVEAMKWGLLHRKDLVQAQDKVKTVIALEFKFGLFYKRILTKDNRVKNFDVSNRIKVAEDAFTELLGIDDRYVWCISAEKLLVEHVLNETVTINLLGLKPPEEGDTSLKVPEENGKVLFLPVDRVTPPKAVS